MNITRSRLGTSPVFTWIKKRRHLCLLALIAALSFGLNFYAVSKFGYGNAYYAAAIKSMTQSFKNFFFVSFDPAGVVMVDKPPLALWIQALFVMVFGYHGWAMLLPQALAGTGSCIMMYILTAKRFGRPAGLLAALFFALTPAAVVASRNNTMDMQLVFVLLVATFYFFKALETSKWRYLFLAALFVGLGFNIKMLQAYMILPAMALTYLIFARENILKRVLAGLIAVVIVAAVSLSWVLAVDLCPEDSRPYVGSSTDNTVMGLVIGHNGLRRIYQGFLRPGGGVQFSFGGNTGARRGSAGFAGQQPAGNAAPGAQGQADDGVGTGSRQSLSDTDSRQDPPGQQDGQRPQSRQQPSSQPVWGGQQSQSGARAFPAAPGQGAGGMTMTRGGGGNNIGTAGIFRLWSKDLYGQASWLIVFALFCILCLLRGLSLKKRSAEQGILVYWTLWLFAMYIFFSFAGFYHRYYLCMFSPAVAALSGIGFAEMIRELRDKDSKRSYFLPASLAATCLISCVYLWDYPGLRTWLLPITLVSGTASVIFIALSYFKDRRFAPMLAAALALVSMLSAPLYWCWTVMTYPPQNSTMPYAGPELASTEPIPGMTANQETFIKSDENTLALEKYLVEHYKPGSYLVVSQSSADVAAFIVDTGLPAVAYGGFLGTDNALSLSRIKELVSEGKITYFLISSKSMGNSEISSYVRANASPVSASEYGGSASSGYSLYLFSQRSAS